MVTKKAKAKKAKRAPVAKPAKRAPAVAAKVESSVRAGTKLEIVVGLLTRPEGCTTKQILEATSWPSVSVPQMAKAAKLKLSKEKTGSVTTYHGAAA